MGRRRKVFNKVTNTARSNATVRTVVQYGNTVGTIWLCGYFWRNLAFFLFLRFVDIFNRARDIYPNEFFNRSTRKMIILCKTTKWDQTTIFHFFSQQSLIILWCLIIVSIQYTCMFYTYKTIENIIYLSG